MNGDLSQGGDGIISGAIIANNVVFENGKGGGSGINCDGVRDSKFQNNLLYNNHASGLSLYRVDGAGGSTGNFVINNTIIQAANARPAINFTGGSAKNTVANNILFHTESGESINVSADSMPGFRSDNNVVNGRFSADDGERLMGLPQWRAATGLDKRSRESTPEEVFVNPLSRDYHLRAGSPAIDAGDAAIAPTTDIDGKDRPARTHSDAGAYAACDTAAAPGSD